jgi:biopolymer transport protein ExbD
MKGFGRSKDDENAGEIDLTPMLDVVFILLIFFIVTAVFVKEAGYDVVRPVAATASETEVEPIFVAISPIGEIWMDGDIIPPRNVRLRIEQRITETPNAGVVVQADQEAVNEHVMLVMDAARQAGVTSIQIAAEE